MLAIVAAAMPPGVAASCSSVVQWNGALAPRQNSVCQRVGGGRQCGFAI